MELRHLRSFVAVAESGTISRAASRCRIAQPSLSQQIRKLEQVLGTELFDRLGRGVALTDAGRALLPRARRILAQVQEAEAALREDFDCGSGRLAVGAIPTMAPYIVPGLVSELRRSYAECEIIIREDLTQNLIEAIVDHELDVALVSTPIEHDLVDVEVIGSEAMVVVAPSDHPLCEDQNVALADLRVQPTVTLHEMHCLGRQITDFCSGRRLARNVVCRMTQISTLLEFVRLGLGVSIVPTMAMDAHRHRGLRFLPFKGPAPSREIALAWRRGRTRPLLARRFAELLRQRTHAEAARRR